MNRKIIVSVILISVILILFIISILDENDRNNKINMIENGSLIGIEVEYRYRESSPISISELNLTPDSINKLTNDTISLMITITNLNKSITYDYCLESNQLLISNVNEYLSISNPKIDHKYFFQIKYVIRSDDSNIKNIKLINNGNIIYGNFIINLDNKINLSVDEEYNDDVSISNDCLILPFNQKIRIRPLVLV